jgi:hypothetical protein
MIDLYGVVGVLFGNISSASTPAGAFGEEEAPVSVSGVIMPALREEPRREGPVRVGDTSGDLLEEDGSEDKSDDKSFSSCFITSFSSFLSPTLSSESLSSESSKSA